MKYLFACLLSLLFLPPVFAQKLKTVEAEYTYHAPENVTLEQARRTALDRAKIQALAEAFGTLVSQYNTTQVENHNGQSTIDFSSIGGSEVKGEWIETLGEPTYHIRYEGNTLVVTCRVRGRAREIVSATLDLQTHVLRNGTDDRFESDQFRSGDDLYLSFQSPLAGFLAVYLVDADRQTFCLLPYRNQTEGIHPIEANRRYLFFHSASVPVAERPLVDEYTMTCDRSSEQNALYIIFSSNSFAKAADSEADASLPRQLPFEDFNRWLVGCRKMDEGMKVIIKMITISNN